MSMRTGIHPRHVLGWVFVGLLVLVAVSIAVSLVAFVFRAPGTGFVFFPFGFWWIFLLFFLFWGFRWWGGGWGWYGRPWGGYYRYHDDAHAILRTRYARGEITREQFEQMMRDLEQHA
ncbi:MAG TPA: SHOCT domain-containing protein [Thermoplasmata archaeon]|nr:SHOCT domain-containing protein [Thermoplasmata archaeon]